MRTLSIFATAGLTISLAGCGDDNAAEGESEAEAEAESEAEACAGFDEDGNADLCEPESGFQIETPAFAVEVGQEVQNCYFFTIPGDEELWVNRIEIVQNDGTHHMNVFRVNTVVNLGTEADIAAGAVEGGECWTSPNWADWPMVINSQESRPEDASNPDDPESTGGHFDWQLPENVAHRFEPGEVIMLQSHYVNVGAGDQLTPSGVGKAVVNFYTVPASSDLMELGTAFATNQSICICPDDGGVTFESSCQLAQDDETVTIIAANSHFHSRGDLFTISVIDAEGDASEPFYESDTWDDPPMARGLEIPIPAGGGVHYACSYHLEDDECGTETRNPNNGCVSDDPCCMTFGGHVENQEHCNIFVFYYPKTRDVGCF